MLTLGRGEVFLFHSSYEMFSIERFLGMHLWLHSDNKASFNKRKVEANATPHSFHWERVNSFKGEVECLQGWGEWPL